MTPVRTTTNATTTATPQCCHHQASILTTPHLRRSNTNRITKAKIKTIKLTLVVVLCFVACFAPFCIAQLVMVYSPPSSGKPLSHHFGGSKWAADSAVSESSLIWGTKMECSGQVGRHFRTLPRPGRFSLFLPHGEKQNPDKRSFPLHSFSSSFLLSLALHLSCRFSVRFLLLTWLSLYLLL